MKLVIGFSLRRKIHTFRVFALKGRTAKSRLLKVIGIQKRGKVVSRQVEHKTQMHTHIVQIYFMVLIFKQCKDLRLVRAGQLDKVT